MTNKKEIESVRTYTKEGRNFGTCFGIVVGIVLGSVLGKPYIFIPVSIIIGFIAGIGIGSLIKKKDD